MNAVEFSHEAMATTFRIVVSGQSEAYGRQAAAAAFRELDRLEMELSRFIESSDIARINRLGVHESMCLGDDALQCLLDALQISALTGLAFDPAYLTQRRSHDVNEPLLALDPAAHSITSLVPRLTLDLGAVGKGYALDRMAAVLREWDVQSACLQSGGSTVLGYSAAGDLHASWPVTIGSRIAQLVNRSVSASGLSVKGSHIVDPRQRTPAVRERRVWSFAHSAAESDALSTAFFVMSDAEILAYCGAHSEVGAAIMQNDGAVHFHGRCPELRE